MGGRTEDTMNRLLKITSLLGLSLTIVPAFLVFTGTITWSTHAWAMMLGTVLWFGSAPFWMGKRTPNA
jgi:hypothetical protein